MGNLYRYHAHANAVLCVAVGAGLFWALCGLSPWPGFFLAGGATFLMFAVGHGLGLLADDARRSLDDRKDGAP